MNTRLMKAKELHEHLGDLIKEYGDVPVYDKCEHPVVNIWIIEDPDIGIIFEIDSTSDGA